MSAQLDKFCSDLRINLKMLDDKLQALNAKARGKADQAEHAVREQMDSVQKKLDKSKTAVEAAKAKANEWAKAQKAAALNKIAEWKAKGDAKNLQARADLADDYAKAMSVMLLQQSTRLQTPRSKRCSLITMWKPSKVAQRLR